ncbi:hypothetical protein, partial [Nocardioides sp. PD653]|uniref:hypothetical protein n=1 Tax=Nocardioides sp. PD653 TaxID=393303 RepID=UPI001A9851C0
AGLCDGIPLPEPKSKPSMDVLLDCGHTVTAVPYWSSDPLYGGWRPPAYAWCTTDCKTVHVRCRAEKPRSRPAEGGDDRG